MPKPVVNNKITYQNIYGLVAKYEGFVGQGVKSGDSPTFANLTLTGDATIEGNLYVEGNTTILDTNITEFEDNILLLNRNETGTGVTLNQSGLEVERGSLENYRMVYNDIDGSFKIGLISNLQSVGTREDSPLDGGIMIWNNSTKRMDSKTTIGLNTTFSSTKNANSITSASVIVMGGLGIDKDIWSKGKIYLEGSNISTANSIWTNSTNNSLNITSPSDIYLTTDSKVILPYDKSLVFGENSQRIVSNALTKHIDIHAGGAVHFNLLAGTKITIPNQIPITFATDTEYIYTDSANNLEISGAQDIKLVPGDFKKVMLPVDKGIGFYNYNQQIYASLNNDLTIEAGNNINLRPGSLLNVCLPTDNGIKFGGSGSQVISANSASDLTISASRDILLTGSRHVKIPEAISLTFGDTSQSIVESSGTLVITGGDQLIIKSEVSITDTLDSDGGSTGSIYTIGGLGVVKTIYSEKSVIVDSNEPGSLTIRKNGNVQDVFRVDNDNTGKVTIVAGDGFNHSMEITSVSNTDAQNMLRYKTAFDGTDGYAIGRGSTSLYSGRVFTLNIPTYSDYLNTGNKPRFVVTSNNCTEELFSITSDGLITSKNTEQSTSSTSASFVISGGLGVAKDILTNGSIKTRTDSSEAIKVSDTNDNTIYLLDNSSRESTLNGKMIVNKNSGIILQLNDSYIVDVSNNAVTNNFRTDITNTTDTTDASSAALVITGGASVQKSLAVYNTAHFYNGLNMHNTTITNVKDPVNLQDVATKAYVDLASLRGLYIKQSVQVATVTAGNLISDFNIGDIIDGYTLQDSDRILIKNQVDPTENGIYIVYPVGPPQRSLDLPIGDKGAGVFTFIKYGDLQGSTGWICNSSNEVDTVGTDPIYFEQFTGLGQITAGDGLSKTFDEISVNVDGTSLEIDNDNLRINSAGLGTGLTGGSGQIIETTSDQSHVTKLGTIDTGVWQASTVEVSYGGTGRNVFTSGCLLFGNGTDGILTDSNLYYNNTTGTFQISNSGGTSLLLMADSGKPEIGLGYNTETIGKIGISRDYNDYANGVYPNSFVVSNDKTDSSSVIQLATKHETRLTITSDGQVGIGTSSPGFTLDVNGTVNISESVTLTSTEDSEDLSSGAIVVSGGISISKSVNIGGVTRFLDETPSTSTVDGAVIIAGGLTVQSGENSSNIGNGGSLTVVGGTSIGGDLWVGGSINGSGTSSTTFAYLTLTATDESINLSTGSMVTLGGITTQCDLNATSLSNGGSILTPGGASIGKDLYIGGDTYIWGTVSLYPPTSEVFKIYDSLSTKRFTFDRDITTNDISLKRYDPMGTLLESSFIINSESGNILFENSTSSTYSSIGSMVLMGGLSIDKQTLATSVLNGGALTIAGGMSVAKNMYVGGNIVLESTTESNGGLSGAILVKGGVSIVKDCNIDGSLTTNDKFQYMSGGLIQSINNTDPTNYMWAYLGEINDITPVSFCELEILGGISPSASFEKTYGLKLLVSINGSVLYGSHTNYGSCNYSTNDIVKAHVYNDGSDRFHLFVLVPPSLTVTINVKIKSGGRFFLLSEGNGVKPNGSSSGYQNSWTRAYNTDKESNLDYTFGSVTVEGVHFNVADPLPILGYNNQNTTSTRNIGVSFQKYQRSNDTGSGDVVNQTAVLTDTLPNQSSATSKQIKLSNSSSAVDEYYTGWWIKVKTGLNQNQTRKIVSYNGSQRVVELDSDWTTQNPVLGDIVELYNKNFVSLYYDNSNNSVKLIQNTFSSDKTITSYDYSDFGVKSIILSDTTSSSNASTGSIRTLGGISISNTTEASSCTAGGTITTLGGASVNKKLYVGDNITVSRTPVSNNGVSLVVKQTTASFLLENDQTYSYINFVNGTNGNAFGIVSDSSNENFSLTATNSGETPFNSQRVLTINSSGNIGIGTTSNINSLMTLRTDSIITSDTNNGSLSLVGGDNLANAGSVIMYGNNASGSNGNVVLSGSGTASSVTININSEERVVVSKDNISIHCTGDSTNGSTGALVVSGGLSVSGTTNSSNATNGGALTVSGGASIEKDTYIGGDLYVTGLLKAIGAIKSPSLVFGWEVNCSLAGSDDVRVTTISDEATLTFSVWVIPDTSSESCQFEFELPDRTSNFNRRTELFAVCTAYTDDISIIPLFNVVVTGVKDQRRGLIKFQSVSTGIHYFSVLCKYTKN